MAIIKKLLRSRVTWRFLVLLAGAFGAAQLGGDLNQLESLVCAVLGCVD